MANNLPIRSITGTFILLIICILFPPYQAQSLNGNLTQSIGYASLFSPPEIELRTPPPSTDKDTFILTQYSDCYYNGKQLKFYTPLARIAFTQLLLQILLIFVVGAGAAFGEWYYIKTKMGKP